MRILLNGLVVYRGGHKTYFLNLIPQFGRIAKDHKFILLHSKWQDFFNFELPPNFERLIIGQQHRSVPKKILIEQTIVPYLIWKEDIDLMFSPTPVTSIFSPSPVIIAIRNSNIYNEVESSDKKYHLRNWILKEFSRFIVNRADAFIFVSQHSRDTALKVLNFDLDKSHIIYHGVSEHFYARSRNEDKSLIPTSHPYILTVSTIQTHKNYPRMIEAFARLIKQEGLPHDYVIIGGVESNSEYDRMNYLIDELNIRDRVHILGEIQNNKLPTIYRSASISVFPSLLESFGHPIVESMASGLPVVASNTSAIPEIGGNAVLYFDPYNINDIVEKVKMVLENNSIRGEMIGAGLRRAKMFSWESTAHEMISLFESIIEG